MTDTYGLSQVERFAEPNPQELAEMVKDGYGRRSAIRFLAQYYMNRPKHEQQSGYDPMTGVYRISLSI